MIIVRVNRQKISVPEKWEELTGKQFYAFFKLVYSGVEVKQIKIRILKMLLNKRWSFFKKWEKDAGEDFITELDDLLKLTDFLFEKDKNDKLGIATNLYVCPFPQQGRKQPGQRLKHMNFYDFCMCDRLYILYSKTGKVEHLDNLIHSLFSQKNRIAIKPFKKMAILHWFACCRKLVFSMLPASTEKEDKFGWAGVIISLAGDKFGTEKEVKETNLWSIVTYIRMQDKKKKE